MKKLIKNYWFFTMAAALMLTLASCSKDETFANNNNGNINIGNLQAQVNSLPKEPLNPNELASLFFMREEEKIARDVYFTLYNKWGVNIFANIYASEQTHMEAVLMLLNKYDLADPVGTNAVGVFNNTSLQNLYNQLETRGNISILEAYKTGATIEDLDLFDLKNALILIDNQDIRLVYDMLTKEAAITCGRFIKIFL